MIGYIYNLQEKDEIFYVGCTVNPYTRLQSHMNRFGCHKYPNGMAYQKKHFAGIKLEILEEIELSDYKDLLRLENYWIHQFIAWGFYLVNENY